MRYLIAGGAGFIGSHLADTLLKHGNYVHILDDLSTGSGGNLPDWIDFTRAPVTDLLLRRRMEDVDVVVHLAASPGVRGDGQSSILAACSANTTRILETARDIHPTPKVIIISSSEVYGKSRRVCLDEDSDIIVNMKDTWRWEYAFSKIQDEFLAEWYCESGQVPTLVCRLFSVVGTRQRNAVVPAFVEKALAGDPIQIHGDGKQVRYFVDVRDVAYCLMQLSQTSFAVGKVNICPEMGTQITTLAKMIKRLTNSDSRIDIVPGTNPINPPPSKPMNNRLKELIGYVPSTPLSDTLGWVIADMSKEKKCT